jgi:dienelactone hydrolase
VVTGKLRVGLTVAVLFALAARADLATAESLRDRIVQNHSEYVPPGVGPFPTLIAIPGCSGVAFPDPQKEATHPDLHEDDHLFRQHYRRMAERFRAEGFAVLLIHVHGAEDLVKACAGEIEAERIAEYIDESVAWAKGLDFVDPARIHVVGWSMGGWGTLAWLHGTRSHTGSVKSVVVVYPGCFDREPPTNPIPLLMLLGDADDIADPRLCVDLVSESAIQPYTTIQRFPGARHGFDVVGAPAVLEIGGGMTVGYQEAAADAAWREMLAFLSRQP